MDANARETNPWTWREIFLLLIRVY